MSSDSVLLRELKSLREEISSSQKQRSARPVDRAPATDAPADNPVQAIKERRFEGEMRELVDAIREFTQEAEKSASAHPAATAVGAMAIGILIGRLLGRR